MHQHDSGKSDFCRLSFDKIPISLWHFDMSAVRADLEYLAGSCPEATGRQPEHETMRALLSKVKLVEVNDATLALYEAPDQQALLANFHVLVPEEAMYALMEGTKALFGPEGAFTTETWNRTFSGKRLDVRMHLFSDASEADSESDHVLMAVDDLTSIRSTDEKLRLLSTLPEANPDMVIFMDCGSSLLYLNPKARAWLERRNYGDDKAIFTILPPDFHIHECGSCTRRSERQSTYQFEDRHYRLTVHPFTDQNRCMITIADVTDLTHVTQERALFSEAMQSSSRPMLITDRTGAILHLNKAFEQLYGYSIDEVRGLFPNVLNPGREVYRNLGYSDQAYDELFSGMWREVLDPDLARWEGEVVNKASDGRILWVHLIMSGI